MFFTIQPPKNVMFQHQHGEVLMGVQATAASQDVTRQNHIPSCFFRAVASTPEVSTAQSY